MTSEKTKATRAATDRAATDGTAAGQADEAEIRIGVSSCLLGQKVRFDGQHKRDRFLVDTLSGMVRFVPVCPEVEVGMGIPRETIRLVRHEKGGEVRLVGAKSGTDHTHAMEVWSRQRIRELDGLDLSGYILKKDSPSCGLYRVRIYGPSGMPSRDGRGLFAAALSSALPLLPMEEEGRLHDPKLRENFFERVFAYRRLQRLFATRWRPGDIVRFHTAEKLLLRAHDPQAHGDIGRLVADVKKRPRAEFVREYRERMLAALSRIATRRKHAGVLRHALGHMRKRLDPADRTELEGVIDEFREGLVPLVVPITLLRHHARRMAIEYLEGQTYLEPHPRELMLRNHV